MGDGRIGGCAVMVCVALAIAMGLAWVDGLAYVDVDATSPRDKPPCAGCQRYGEADHPGPGGGGGDRGMVTNGCAAYRSPRQPGFHHALMDADGEHDTQEELFSLVIDSCNSTSWGGAMRYLASTTADVVLLQEHHLPPSKLAEASAWALRRGWHPVYSRRGGEGSRVESWRRGPGQAARWAQCASCRPD
jgi:hypothetical protein